MGLNSLLMPLMNFSLIMVLLINYLALTHPNKMEWPKGNIGILLCVLSHSKWPVTYWAYAISTVVHLINRLATPLLHNLSPWELLFQAKLDLLLLKVFRCTCFPLLKPYNTQKFQPHTSPCVFLGYPLYSKYMSWNSLSQNLCYQACFV